MKSLKSFNPHYKIMPKAKQQVKIAFELEIGNFNLWDKIREKCAILWKSKIKKFTGLFEIFFLAENS